MATVPALRDPRERVHPRARLMWSLSAVIEGLVLVAVLTVGLRFSGWFDLAWWWVVLGLLVVAAWAVVVPQWRYRVHRWEVTDTAVYTQVGWWARERRIAPMSRIQTVEVEQGPLSRLFGLATVTVTTASSHGALRVAGLERARAYALADELTAKADVAEGDAT